MTFTGWVQALNTRDDSRGGGGNIYSLPKTCVSVPVQPSIYLPFVVSSVYNKPIVKFMYSCNNVHAVAQLVEVLRYKSEGRGFDSRWCHWNFSLT